MGCLAAFWGNINGAKHPFNVKVTSVLIEMFREKIWPGPKKLKNVVKTAKTEGYNTRFWIFLGPELRTPQNAS